jgi:hypothetical protein
LGLGGNGTMTVNGRDEGWALAPQLTVSAKAVNAAIFMVPPIMAWTMAYAFAERQGLPSRHGGRKDAARSLGNRVPTGGEYGCGAWKPIILAAAAAVLIGASVTSNASLECAKS